MTPFQEGNPWGREALKGFYLLVRKIQMLVWDSRGLWAGGNSARVRKSSRVGSDGVGLGGGLGPAFSRWPWNRLPTLGPCLLRSPFHGLWQPCPPNRLWSGLHPTGSHWPLETCNRMIFDRQANLVQPRLSTEAHRGHQTSPTDVGPGP